MTAHTLWMVFEAMRHGFTCHAEYHPGAIVNHHKAGWYEIICAKASQAIGVR